jgi:uncharacterized membrane protein
MAKKEVIVSHPNYKGKLTFGQKASDVVTYFIGSWKFIFFMILLMGVWICGNVMMFLNRWDPYPFILLNLVLGCIGSLISPVILMSQNRQDEKNRVRANYDYAVDRKAEREVEQLKKDVKEIKDLLLKRK